MFRSQLGQRHGWASPCIALPESDKSMGSAVVPGLGARPLRQEPPPGEARGRLLTFAGQLNIEGGWHSGYCSGLQSRHPRVRVLPRLRPLAEREQSRCMSPRPPGHLTFP